MQLSSISLAISRLLASGASLDFQFAGATTLDPLITFTRASTATFFNSSGVLTSAAIDAPRLDYNPSTLAAQGLLIEEARTNSIRNNTMQGAVAGTPGTLPTNWGISGLGTLTQQIVGPIGGSINGINYIDIRFSGTTSTTQISLNFESNNQIAAVNGQSWAWSFWIARVGGSSTNIIGQGGSVNVFDSTPAYLTDIAATVFPLTGTIARVSNSGTIVSPTAAFLRPLLYLQFNSGVAIDITLRIGLPQLELGSFATSVIPTTTTALTRSADDARVNVLSPWYNQTAGTLFVERIRGPLDAVVTRRYVNISDGSISTNVAIQNIQGSTGTSNNVSYVAGVSDFAPNPSGTSAEGAIVKTATAIDGTGKAMCRDGGTVSTSAVLPALSGMTTMFIGWQGSSTSISCTWIRRITYYPRRLSNDELQAITP